MADKGSPKKFDTNITIAVIGLLSAAIVAAITNADKLANAFRRPEPTATIVSTAAIVSTAQLPPTQVVPTATFPPTAMPTDTVLPGTATSTPLPPTDTPVPTPTPIPLGADWPQNCISTLWQPYGSPALELVPIGNGCWQQPIYYFATNNGSLNFLDDGRNSSSQVYGLFAPLPGTSGTVTVKVRLRELSKADLLLGVYEKQDLGADGVLMAIRGENLKNGLKIVQMLSYTNYKSVDGTQAIQQNDGYTIKFTYSATSVTAQVPGVRTFNQVTVSGAQKYIFLGYRKLNPGYTANGSFVSLEVTQ